MTKTLTIGQIDVYYNILNGASIAKVVDKLPIIKLLRVLKPISVAFVEMRRDTEEKCRPENWDAIIAEYNRTNVRTPAINRFLAEVNSYVAPEANKEKEISFDIVSEDILYKMDFQDITAGMFEELLTTFCE